MNIQRLRNLTTGILHTEIAHVYEDLEYIIGETGLMTHMLPNVMRAVEPWLREQVTDPRFWEERLDVDHQGEHELRPMTAEESAAALQRYSELPHPFASRGQ